MPTCTETCGIPLSEGLSSSADVYTYRSPNLPMDRLLQRSEAFNMMAADICENFFASSSLLSVKHKVREEEEEEEEGWGRGVMGNLGASFQFFTFHPRPQHHTHTLTHTHTHTHTHAHAQAYTHLHTHLHTHTHTHTHKRMLAHKWANCQQEGCVA